MLYTESNTDLACYIFHINELILTIFGRKYRGVWAIISIFNLSCLFAITSLIGWEITKAEITHFQCHWLFANMPFTKEDKFWLKICLSWKATMLGI